MRRSGKFMGKMWAVLTALALVAGGLFGTAGTVRADSDQPCLQVDAPDCTNGLPTEQYQQLLADMQADPSPNVTTIPFDLKEVHQYAFYKVLPSTTVYDNANGNAVGTLDNGFTYVTIYGVKDGFARLRNGTWVKKTSLQQTYASTYAGVKIDQPLKYPLAWVIQGSLPTSVPNGVRKTSTPAIKRYTLVNIFATVNVDGWDWYLVGPGQWLEQRKLARLIPVSKPEGSDQQWVNVNLYEQVLTAYDGDTPVFATLISSGLTQWQTNTGLFQVKTRVQSTPMSGAMGEPDFYSLPAVPYVMFFDGDISLHGTYWHDGFGFKHSHGCVNMSIADAHWLYNWVGDAAQLSVFVTNDRVGGGTT